jgi:hypothetical protein
MVIKEEKKENGMEEIECYNPWEEADDLDESPSPAALWLVETLLSTSNKVTPRRGSGCSFLFYTGRTQL